MVLFRPYLYQLLSLNHHNDNRLVKMRLRIGVAHLTVELETFDGRYIALGTRSGIPKDDVPENGPTVARVDSYRPCHDGTLPPFESNPVYRKTVHVENWATTQVFSSLCSPCPPFFLHVFPRLSSL